MNVDTSLPNIFYLQGSNVKASVMAFITSTKNTQLDACKQLVHI